MNWIAITVADLNDTKLAPLVDALRSAALGEGQADPSAEIIESVVDRIRAEIASSTKNRLDADTTKIPKSLKRLAVRLVLAELKNRLEEALTKDESEQMDRDVRYLERIAKGEIVIDTPDAPAVPEVEGGAGVQVASKSTRRATRQTLSGL